MTPSTERDSSNRLSPVAARPRWPASSKMDELDHADEEVEREALHQTATRITREIDTLDRGNSAP
jgi:hypothetical protein